MGLGDEHLFYFGEVYTIKDELISFIPRDKSQVDPDKTRYVVVLQNDRECNDPGYPILTVAPITSKVEGQTKQCLLIEPGEADLPKPSLIKAGLIQPIAKDHLRRRQGRLKADTIKKLYGLLYGNLGFREAKAMEQKQEQAEAQVPKPAPAPKARRAN